MTSEFDGQEASKLIACHELVVVRFYACLIEYVLIRLARLFLYTCAIILHSASGVISICLSMSSYVFRVYCLTLVRSLYNLGQLLLLQRKRHTIR